MAFEQKRSEAAQQKYFEAVKRSREAVEMRRRTRDAEKQKAKEREILRELERLRELQEEQEDELRKQAWKDDMLQQRMQRELEKMHEMKEQLGACRHAEDGLDAEYETQLEELRARERDTELFITRRVTREKAKTSLMQELDNLRRDAEDKARRLQEDARAIEQAHVGSLLESKEAAKSRVALHSVMELGRTMRLAGVTRADEAHKLGIIRLPIAPP
ncbi:hypothetical protein DIPPA_29953 [Diplonema papillatum]|nr:hypothetical protein DIPPA_29953 [Diplonema papillatum]